MAARRRRGRPPRSVRCAGWPPPRSLERRLLTRSAHSGSPSPRSPSPSAGRSRLPTTRAALAPLASREGFRPALVRAPPPALLSRRETLCHSPSRAAKRSPHRPVAQHPPLAVRLGKAPPRLPVARRVPRTVPSRGTPPSKVTSRGAPLPASIAVHRIVVDVHGRASGPGLREAPQRCPNVAAAAAPGGPTEGGPVQRARQARALSPAPSVSGHLSGRGWSAALRGLADHAGKRRRGGAAAAAPAAPARSSWHHAAQTIICALPPPDASSPTPPAVISVWTAVSRQRRRRRAVVCRGLPGRKQVVVVIVFVRYSVFAFRECKRVCPLKLELLNSV